MQREERQDADQRVWKSQTEERMDVTIEDLCIRAHRREMVSIRAYWLFLAIAGLFCAALIANVVRFRGNPWLLIGNAIAIVALSLPALRVVRKGPAKMRTAEPCLDFIRRELEDRRQGLSLIRWTILLLLPAMVACWFGGGPLLRAKALGIHSDWVLALFKGPVPVLGLTVLLIFVWAGFTKDLRRIERELQRLEK